ncbi:MAG: signal peptide peptidase SppA [Patescibacteria group bacterium]
MTKAPNITTPPKKRKIWLWFLGCFGILIFLGSVTLNIFLFFAIFSKNVGTTINTPAKNEPKLQEIIVTGRKEAREKIAQIYIEGPILYQEDSWQSLTERNGGADFIVKQIHQAKTDSKIKAIILNIKSPGGSITASDEIYQEIASARTTGKKVIAFLNETAASGGYYIALPTDKIIASPTTLTGSIGVIAQTFNIEELLARYGVKIETIKSGKYKDILSSYREMTPEERELLQNILDEYYKQFVNLTKKHRPDIDLEKLEEITDGRVFTARQAKELKLIDELGYENDAINLAAKLSKIREKTVIKYKQPFSWESFFSQASLNFSQNAMIKNLMEMATFSQRKILYR